VHDEREANNQIGGVGHGHDHRWSDGRGEPRGQGWWSGTRPRGLPWRVSGLRRGVSRSRVPARVGLPTRLALRRVVSTLLVRLAVPAVPPTLPLPLSVPRCLPWRRFPVWFGILRSSITCPSPWSRQRPSTQTGDVTAYWISASVPVTSPYLSPVPRSVPIPKMPRFDGLHAHRCQAISPRDDDGEVVRGPKANTYAALLQATCCKSLRLHGLKPDSSESGYHFCFFQGRV
jgi:hypothetical protein